MSRTALVGIFFSLLFAVFVVEIGYLHLRKRAQNTQAYVAITGVSDMAIFSGVLPLRFYALESGSELWDDPLLLPRERGDFIYRVHR